jgi:hypothetical protein
MGVHQRIDRIARRDLAHMLPKNVSFPSQHDILHFEGLNGPDGIKRKSPGRDEPWHYLDPRDPSDKQLRSMINDHRHNLIQALVDGNTVRASFEAAWMAHAITDGLTPAHHYPLEERLEQLRDGKGLESRTTAKDKLLLPGKTRRQQLRNNWEFWGAKGIMTTHLAFELGIATTLAAGRLSDTAPTPEEFLKLKKSGFMAVFDDTVTEIADLELYEEFYKVGWTRRLANDTRRTLIPEIIRMVCLAWYDCAIEADVKRRAA